MAIGYAGAFLGGVAAILSPCAALLLPAFFAYAFGGDRARLVGRTALFLLGTLLTLVPLGLGAGALVSALSAHRESVALIGGCLLIAFGITQALGVPLRIPGLSQRGDPRGPLGAILLGATYGLAGSCTGPLLGAVLTVAAVGGSAAYGAALLACFAVGMVAPLLVLAWAWDRLRVGERLRPRPLSLGPLETSWMQLVSGAAFVAVGVLFLTTDATASIGGLLDASAQYRLESWLGSLAGSVPDLAFLGVAVVLGAVAAWRWLRPAGSRSKEPEPTSTT